MHSLINWLVVCQRTCIKSYNPAFCINKYMSLQSRWMDYRNSQFRISFLWFSPKILKFYTDSSTDLQYVKEHASKVTNQYFVLVNKCLYNLGGWIPEIRSFVYNFCRFPPKTYWNFTKSQPLTCIMSKDLHQKLQSNIL